MNQLDIFTKKESSLKIEPQKKGRPSEISAELVFLVIDAINKKQKNNDIISKYPISRMTFYRIKRGEYNHLLHQALNDAANEFSLELTD